MAPATMPESLKADIAVNIFGKPFQVSLAILSLLARSRAHINKIWLNYEPYGSQFDNLSPLAIYDYLKETSIVKCEASQPDYWLGREAPDLSRIGEPEYRYGIRYQRAWEKSAASYLFIIHNDVYFFKDLLGAMLAEIGDAAAIGQIGQCWNCPASRSQITLPVCGLEPCDPGVYRDFNCSVSQLQAIYSEARQSGIFKRAYDPDSIGSDFLERPWPLPECRVNEWACLINLEKTRPLTMPIGPAWPFGAFKACGDLHLDIGVQWFRNMHAMGLTCKHVNVHDYLRHWVGTGNKSRARYAHAEANALVILKKHFPDFISWLKKKEPDAVPE